MRVLVLAAVIVLALLACWLLVGEEPSLSAAHRSSRDVRATAPALTSPEAAPAPVTTASPAAAAGARVTQAPSSAAREAASADGVGGPASSVTVPPDVRVAGEVRDGRGHPVAGAVVEAAPQQNAPAMASAVTDARGRYELVLDADRAPSVVRAHARGHALTLAKVPYQDLIAAVVEGPRGPSLRLELPPIVLRDAVGVELRVRSSDGAPLPALVALANADLYAWPLRHAVGRDGSLRLELPPARYAVKATATGHVRLETSLDVVDGAVVELVLVRGETLRGRVVDERGAPVPRGTMVKLYEVGAAGQAAGRPSSRRCMPDGEFEFESVAAGEYDVLVTGRELGGVSRVTVSAGQGGQVEVRAAPRARVRGRVVWLGRSGAWGHLRLRHARLGEREGHDLFVLPDGTYAADGLLAGEWLADYGEQQRGVRWRASFTVAPGEDATRDLRFEGLVEVRGVVVDDDDGRPRPEAAVIAEQVGADRLEVACGPDGVFVLRLAPGAYDLSATGLDGEAPAVRLRADPASPVMPLELRLLARDPVTSPR